MENKLEKFMDEVIKRGRDGVEVTIRFEGSFKMYGYCELDQIDFDEHKLRINASDFEIEVSIDDEDAVVNTKFEYFRDAFYYWSRKAPLVDVFLDFI